MPPTRHPSSKRGLFYGLVELGREWLIGTGLRAGTSSAPSLLILFVHDGIIGGEAYIGLINIFCCGRVCLYTSMNIDAPRRVMVTRCVQG